MRLPGTCGRRQEDEAVDLLHCICRSDSSNLRTPTWASRRSSQHGARNYVTNTFVIHARMMDGRLSPLAEMESYRLSSSVRLMAAAWQHHRSGSSDPGGAFPWARE